MDLLAVVLLLLLAGVGAGLVGSLSGMGGAVVMIPVLVIGFGRPFGIWAARFRIVRMWSGV